MFGMRRPIRRMPPWLIVTFLSIASTAVRAAALDDSAESQRILRDLKFLAADEQEGRGVGTAGLDRSADYLREQFRAAGLKPALPDGGYFQSFETPNGSRLGEPNQITVQIPGGKSIRLERGKDFVPVAISGAGKFDGPLVFAGYGISAPKIGYDDFADFDVRDKVVIILGRGPRQSSDPNSPPDPHAAIGRGQLELKQKASNAASHGAAAVLFVDSSRATEERPDRLMEFGEQGDFRVAKIPVAQITRSMADQLLGPALGKSVEQLRGAIDADLKPQSAVLADCSCSGEITVNPKGAAVKNVLGVLEGSGSHARETIVIGAHYDHLGFGESGSMAPGSHEIHNGADDNASGTTGLLELARRLAKRDQPLPRRVLFAAFTAEERGLIGSDYYVKNPAIPLDQTIAMINLDMIGRLRNEKLIVEGVGTAQEFRPLVEAIGTRRGFNLKPLPGGMGPSDQTSFCLKKVPVLFFWTDYHSDYHKPTDDWDKISVDGIDRIVSTVEEAVTAIAGWDSRPAFVEVPVPAAPSGESSGERAYLGTVPAFGEEVDGVLLSGVTAGSPSDKAGIRGGDVLVQIGDLAVHNLQDMQTALESHRPGARIKITVRRGTLLITYPVVLGRRP